MQKVRVKEMVHFPSEDSGQAQRKSDHKGNPASAPGGHGEGVLTADWKEGRRGHQWFLQSGTGAKGRTGRRGDGAASACQSSEPSN